MDKHQNPKTNNVYNWRHDVCHVIKFLIESVRYHSLLRAITSTMQLFQLVLKHLQTMGIYSIQSNKTHSFNSRILFFSLFIMLLFTAMTVYFLFGAKTIPEYANSFYRSIAELSVFMDFGLTIWLLPNILMMIENYENFIEKR